MQDIDIDAIEASDGGWRWGLAIMGLAVLSAIIVWSA